MRLKIWKNAMNSRSSNDTFENLLVKCWKRHDVEFLSEIKFMSLRLQFGTYARNAHIYIWTHTWFERAIQSAVYIYYIRRKWVYKYISLHTFHLSFEVVETCAFVCLRFISSSYWRNWKIQNFECKSKFASAEEVEKTNILKRI